MTAEQFTAHVDRLRDRGLRAIQRGLPVRVEWAQDILEREFPGETPPRRRVVGDAHIRIDIGEPVPEGWEACANNVVEAPEGRPLTRDEVQTMEGAP